MVLIPWIVIYPMDNTPQPLNNLGVEGESKVNWSFLSKGESDNSLPTLFPLPHFIFLSYHTISLETENRSYFLGKLHIVWLCQQCSRISKTNVNGTRVDFSVTKLVSFDRKRTIYVVFHFRGFYDVPQSRRYWSWTLGHFRLWLPSWTIWHT